VRRRCYVSLKNLTPFSSNNANNDDNSELFLYSKVKTSKNNIAIAALPFKS
jgi:hypothetical protein